jgi:hypothetical protein
VLGADAGAVLGLIDRMLTRGLEDQPATAAPTVVTASRFRPRQWSLQRPGRMLGTCPSTLLCAQATHLEPGMQLEAWNASTKVPFDRQLWAELTSMRFVTDSYNVLIMGPVGGG